MNVSQCVTADTDTVILTVNASRKRDLFVPCFILTLRTEFGMLYNLGT